MIFRYRCSFVPVSCERGLTDFIERNDLEQLNTETTRSTGTSSTLLDLLITSAPHSFMSAEVIKSGVSDHFLIYGVLSTKSKQAKELQQRIIETQKIDLKANHETFLNEVYHVPWSFVTQSVTSLC